ncbi:hypothetical protein CONLIGDRAFT_81240 [Coniochaeta ligniaria NRRL 30616]|uniref:Uncharacterized protein n=1 Tax=Coniochaeta ligniaria NRRL 30616 TaxID=1408157 RepID=A0A1J7IBQ4_9PEZI|nr:hypothetical protein CONLIGDRAFT_81240 [Coniochaeta ligniaria NRRL 30616]
MHNLFVPCLIKCCCVLKPRDWMTEGAVEVFGVIPGQSSGDRGRTLDVAETQMRYSRNLFRFLGLPLPSLGSMCLCCQESIQICSGPRRNVKQLPEWDLESDLLQNRANIQRINACLGKRRNAYAIFNRFVFGGRLVVCLQLSQSRCHLHDVIVRKFAWLQRARSFGTFAAIGAAIMALPLN